MNKKQISIIVPIYNIEQYLDRCISSIVAQTYKDIEIILVDDGSTDDSGMICDKYASADQRVKVIHKSNGGLVSARKKGLSVAEGEYIGFVDGDDFIEEMMYEKLVTSIEEQQVDFIHSGYLKNSNQIYSVKSEKKYRLNSMVNKIEIIRDLVLDETREQSITPSIWSKLFRSNLIKEIYANVPDSQPYGEDLLCLCECILKCDTFGVISDAYYNYLKRGDSICNEKKIDNIQREMRLYETLKRLFEKYGLYAEIHDSLERFYLKNLLTCIKQLTDIICPVYQYPVIDELLGKRVLLYGAGEVGRDYYAQICQNMNCTIVAVADKNANKYHFDFMRLIRAEEIVNFKYDVILIAVLNEKTAAAIRDELVTWGIAEEKILWRSPGLTV